MDETWLSIGGAKRPVAVVLGPKGEGLDLRLSGPDFDGSGWFTSLAARKLLVMLNAIMQDQVPWQREPVTKPIHT